MASEAWASSGPSIIHQAGARDFGLVQSRIARDDYVVMEATDDFGELLRCVDLAVSRAGGTVWELAAAGTPAILVPYPYATADHQTLNARHFERGGGAIIVPDAEVGRVPALVDELLAAPERLAAMREGMLSLARPDAADLIADELVALARGRD
ncbi:MAG TPA: glycosyltransferase [Gaiella sp.]